MYDDGQYIGRILRHELGQTEGPNPKPQLVLQVEIFGFYPEGNPEADLSKAYDEISPRRRHIWWTITPASYRRKNKDTGKMENVKGSWPWILETVRYAGWTGTDLEDLDHEDPQGFKFDSKAVFVFECQNKEYQGSVRDKWNMVRPGRQVAGSVKPNNRQKFFAELRDKFACGDAPASASATKPATVGVVNDNVPF